MKVTVVIVTYSNRFHLLKQVLESCLESGVNNIVVVDNNSDENSSVKIKNFVNKNKKLELISNKTNLGSAKAYKQGLKRANQIDNEYIWLLDDDNKPRKNALSILKGFWDNKPKNVSAILSYRPDRYQYKDAVIYQDPTIVLSKKNSFSGFHLKDKILKLVSRPKKSVNNSFGEIAYAPYGGLLFHKKLLNKIGYPNEKFYLYSDDHDWTYRITKQGNKIFIVLDSVIDDIDTSWAIKNKEKTIFTKIKNAPPFRVYYTIRNRMIFEKEYLISNKLIYNLNKNLFSVILFLFSFRSKNFKVFKRALSDANNNNLENY
ncbi:glycosyltransferase [uncultured Polaribacter sp.]|uniref:glycosyltransferase n=1 Tax=uncultured Polaribacter sp. TaxID=174711 RepID=UPI0026116A73|nr:glycosyltransferase [uncultured Polaribacter sp.]